jgi:hypothetical protein
MNFNKTINIKTINKLSLDNKLIILFQTKMCLSHLRVKIDNHIIINKVMKMKIK